MQYGMHMIAYVCILILLVHFHCTDVLQLCIFQVIAVYFDIMFTYAFYPSYILHVRIYALLYVHVHGLFPSGPRVFLFLLVT